MKLEGKYEEVPGMEGKIFVKESKVSLDVHDFTTLGFIFLFLTIMLLLIVTLIVIALGAGILINSMSLNLVGELIAKTMLC